MLDTGRARGESYFVVEGAVPPAIVGQTLFVEAEGARRAYPVRAVKTVEGQTRIYTKIESAGFEARPAQTWEFLTTTAWEKR